VDGNQLTLSYLPGQTGTADITVRGTDSANAWEEDTFTVTVTPAATIAQVVGRYIFYNNSAYDATDDDAAIAPDPATAGDPGLGKEALMPGGTAGFQNYTGYSRGINGIMVDFEELPDGVIDLGTADFTFKVGNDNDPDNWSAAPDPADILLERIEGQPARATIIWTDGAIANKWLQVTVNVTDDTGLENPDVFYFGNSVGEVGDAGDGLVTYSDLIQTRNDINLTLPVGIDSKFDFDRSRYIDYTDLILCRNNINLSTGLNMISVPALPPSVPEETLESTVAAPALHDMVLEEAAPESTPSGASLAELAWFYDREQLLASGRSSAKSTAPQSAVDKLLSTWP